MSNHGIGNTLYNDLFSSLISEIKSYNGTDPLIPWIRGIKKMKETVPPQLLKEKLPRFLQKCSETFLTDRRYSNDLRYLRVWLQLMDFVDNPKAVLRKMERNGIGTKKSLFYQAYALYYEKRKKFDAADKIYHQGVHNLAEPADELQKSYEQFLQRMERNRNKRLQHQERKSNIASTSANNTSDIGFQNNQLSEKVVVSDHGVNCKFRRVNDQKDEHSKKSSDDTVVGKFVNTAIVGKCNAEDARHHGLVEPTIHTKEAMNAINSMFREPLEPSNAGRRQVRKQPKPVNNLNSEFKVFTEELQQSISKDGLSKSSPERSGANPNLDEPFEIYVDGEETNDVEVTVNKKDIHAQNSKNVMVSSSHVFAKIKDPPTECSKDQNTRRVNQNKFREDTVVYRFVGSTISDESQVENAWHHGLVDPTINFKEAMNDINSMFGKPIEYARKSRSKKQDSAQHDLKNNCGEFLIFPDDESDNQKPLDFAKENSPNKRDEVPVMMKDHDTGFLILPDDDDLDGQEGSSGLVTEKGSDLFERTMCTKEAMDEINKLFAMPMDF